LNSLPHDIQSHNNALILLTSEEPSISFANFEFEDRSRRACDRPTSRRGGFGPPRRVPVTSSLLSAAGPPSLGVRRRSPR
jgi:hypothetical protein